MNAALDNYHNAAYQSESLTLFNEFTSPPDPAATSDEKALSGELQGGLSGLYSRFRTSVGGVRDIVSGGGKSTDKNATEAPAIKGPPLERSIAKPVSDLATSSADYLPSQPNSSQGLRLHSPVVPDFHTHQDLAQLSNLGKRSRISSKSGSISSKASVSPSPGIKPSIAPLTKATGSAIVADPAVTQLHVSVIGNSDRSRSSSINGPFQGNHNAESTSIGNKEGLLEISMSQTSSSWSQNLSSSPVLSTKMHDSHHEEFNSKDTLFSATYTADNQSRTSVPASNQQTLPENSSQSTNMQSIKQSELVQDNSSQRSGENSKSRAYLPSEELKASVSKSKSLSISSLDEAPYKAESLQTNMETNIPRESANANEPPKVAAPSRSNEESTPSIRAARLPGYVISRASTAETTTTVSSLPSLNTEFERPTGQSLQARRQPPAGGDSVLSQLRSKLLSRDFWMRDENAKDCFHCGESFTTFRRKHHCRTCGQIFDSKCTLLISGTRFGQPGRIRVCKPCEKMINAHDDDSSELSDSEQSPIVGNPRVSELSWTNTGPTSADDDDSYSAVSQSIDHVLRTPTMAIPATRRAGEGHNRRSAILEIDSDRPLVRPTSSRSLRSSLSGRPHSISHKRHHSRQQYIRGFKPFHEDRAPFQRRHADDIDAESRLPAFHKDNIIDPEIAQYLSDDASSGDEQPSLLSAVSESALSKSGGENERASFGGLLAAMKKGRSAFGDRTIPSMNRDADETSITSSRAVNLPRFSRRRNLSVTSNYQPRHSPRTSKDNMLPHDTLAPVVSLPEKTKQVGFKMTRSSSMRGNDAPPVELNKASLEHVRKLLHQLLVESTVPNGDSWENALMPILLKAADEVDPDVQKGDDMDIRHYVKLKKIPGGRPSDTSYVSGLVFTKNLALKGMSRNILCPNILIITFPLEYARQQQHFMSLEPVIRQEREFLENLVSRISALRPNLLLVEKTVSGLALGLLEQAGIATAYNVKPSVLEAVSRCTQTRIMTSMDKLLTTTLHSECSSFDVKTYVHNGRKKTYMYISGCPKELGCTIILRGGDDQVLGKVKRITEFMVYVVYNLRLETNLMRDEFGKISTSPTEESTIVSDKDKKFSSQALAHEGNARLIDKCIQQGTNEKYDDISDGQVLVDADAAKVPDNIPMPTYYNDVVKDYDTKILSASPFVKFEPPYLLTRAREMERRLSYLKSLRDQDRNSDQTTDEKVKPQKFVLITPEMVHQSPQDAPAKVKEVLHAAHEAEYDRALYHHQTQKRQWEAFVAGNPNMFDPYAHQNLVILYSLVCTTTSVPCSGPDTFALEFYNEHGDDTIFESDLTVGQYVEDLCHTANSVCTVNGCEKRMFEHHRQYVHGEAQISVLVQPYPSKLRGLHNSVLMWSCCKVCGNETQVMPMSQNTWKYSFGKYLELSFWGRHLLARTGGCSHDLRRDYFHYFGYRDLALRVQYDPIRLLEIIVPRPRVTWKVDNDLKLRNEVYLRTEQRISKFMASVQDRLKRINVESVVPELLESCKTEIETLIKKGHEDHSSLVRYLQEKYTSSSYWEIIPLNEVLRAVQEKVVEWDMTFADFEMNFFPSEKDIKHMATLQLKKIFLDKDATSVSADDTLQTPTDVEDESNQEVDRPRKMRRMTLSPEKAQDVLVSVVEEHAGKKHREELQEVEMPSPPVSAEESSLTLDAAGGTRPSPQDEAVSQEEIRHLDLAVPTGQSEHSSVGNADISNQSPSNISLPMMVPGDGSSESSLPEISEMPDQGSQNETEDSGASDLQSTPVRRPSAIPRPTEPALRRTGKVRSPPLVRAQSQPANLPRSTHSIQLPGLKLAFTNLIDPEKPAVQSSAKPSDRKLSDRLGLSSLKNARFGSGHSLIPRSAPGKRGISQVSNLARHFEQLSREFEKERQRERRQRAAKGTQSRAFPLASSKPIVEVYRNVREAVEEREPPVDNDESSPSVPRIPMDDLSRKSDELTHDDITHEEPSLPNSSPPTPTEVDSALCSDNQLLSGGEVDDHQSDEDQNMVEDLHPVDSHEETKHSAEDDSIDFKELPRHERNTLLKILTNFWSERSASGWASLDYPLSVMDHVFADCNIIVREDEPSSLVAFALDSSDYKEKLSSIQQRFDEVEEQKPGADDNEAVKEARVEHALLRPTGTHLKYQFQEGQAKMLCKVFYAEQFDALRKKCGVADRIVESLSRCAKWDSKGGKTKSLFLKTLDDRFILKSLSPIETQAFLKFAPAYFQIMSEALFHELPSAIAKMFGFYQVIIKNPVTGTEFNWFLLLMENLFYDRVPTRIFDLKGSMRNRKVESTGERNEVLLDENMVDFIYETPLFAREHSKKLIGQSVWNDTLFLGRQDVMDYSLMIAIDESRNELVVGIIDCIRTYTWDKKLESWIKDKGFAGGGRNRPTVTSPREYKGRFREAMASCWHQFQPNGIYRYENQATEAETVGGNGLAKDSGY
ncbi:1-phosphatidylinositol-3-phosphate 5-kinase (Fab1), putative [Penicillium digitatum PHI26]|uniref:1-phosphatidylinositol-3-phosphate 5-kinase n=2 Tax=Penicillium digitatum TaxID=36651 RepID=K9FMF0_PEND2|nr:1-phosphatidylinositol-3-phosphate 5-kinase (Fab1), putative [Penicillium digitatum Pd1]EKV08092.1 1-phosphatidylinositol-3-phosphate 5-kinase (Fab1), putative [Penicillium digitatum Pd1]EKV09502.1 1-phosphatidylinositol-3-phosphate 5-kinase (Fab1), putative [Penicillium digitatum PHI26]